ncbi:MAG: outer spore coat protein CotE [Ignavibacteriales bacterium]
MSGSARGVTGQGFREIITRAVYGRGEGVAHGVVTFPNVGEVKKVLGAMATEFRLGDVSLRCSGEEVVVLANGRFDVHVWYICGEDTAVSKQAVSATVEIPVTPFGREPLKEHDVRVAVVNQPQCRKVTVKEHESSLEIEVTAMLKAEVVGETKLRVVLPVADGEPVSQVKPTPDSGDEPAEGAGQNQ